MTAHESALDEYSSQSIGSEAGKPELTLWAAVLRLMLEDAQRYWQGRTPELDYEHEQAFDDVVACGPMLRRCCGFLDLDAQWISEAFVKQCDIMA